MPTGAIIAIVIIVFIMIIGAGLLVWYSTSPEEETSDYTEKTQDNQDNQDNQDADETQEVVEVIEEPVFTGAVSQNEDNLIKPVNNISKCIPKCWWLSNRTDQWVDFSSRYPTKEGCNKNDGPGGGLYKWDC